jgi:hypothetical protein
MRFVKNYLAAALILLLAHSILVAWVWVQSETTYGNNPGGDFIWLIFGLVDWPVWTLIVFISNGDAEGRAAIFVLGGLQWFTLGLALQWFGIVLYRILGNARSTKIVP